MNQDPPHFKKLHPENSVHLKGSEHQPASPREPWREQRRNLGSHMLGGQQGSLPGHHPCLTPAKAGRAQPVPPRNDTSPSGCPGKNSKCGMRGCLGFVVPPTVLIARLRSFQTIWCLLSVSTQGAQPSGWLLPCSLQRRVQPAAQHLAGREDFQAGKRGQPLEQKDLHTFQPWLSYPTTV